MNPSAASERTAYHDVYMAMEVLIERFGGKEKAVAALGKCVEDAKRLANSKRHIKKKDSRHRLREIDGIGNPGHPAYERYLTSGRGGGDQ